MQCEICNKEAQLYIAEIEGSKVNVCAKCGKYGQVIRRISEQKKAKKRKSAEKSEVITEPEMTEAIIDDYSSLIKKKREKIGLTQKELAKKLAEKESLIHKIESGHFEPSISLAKKLGKFLKIKLVEEVEEKRINIQKGKDNTFTIGDLVKVRRK